MNFPCLDHDGGMTVELFPWGWNISYVTLGELQCDNVTGALLIL